MVPDPVLVFAGVVPVVVAAVFEGVDAAGVFVPPLEPDAVPFKQLVLAKLNENTRCKKKKITTYNPL